MPRYVVLGAGVAGLAAAVTLVRRGEKDVLLLEREERPGGHCRSVTWQGCTLDYGPHRILITIPRIRPFILGFLGNDMLTVQRRSQMVLLGRRIDYPPRASQILMALGPRRSARILTAFLAKGILAARRAYAEDSYAGYISLRFGTGLYDLLFRDYARKVWQEDPQDLDAAVARIRLSSRGLADSLGELFRRAPTHAARDFLYPRSGIGELPDRMMGEILAAGGKIECGARIRSVGHAAGGNSAVEYGVEDRTKTVGYRFLLSTIPLPALFSLMKPPPPEDVLSAAAALRYSSVRLVCLLISRPNVTGNTWMYFPGREFQISRLYEVANFANDLTPRNKSCLVVEVPCRMGDPTWRLPDKHLTQKVVSELEDSGLTEQSEVEASRVIGLPEAYPVYRRGYRDRLEQCCAYLSAVPGLITTGRQGLFCYNNMDHSIDMGIRAAESAMLHPEDPRSFYAQRPEFDKYRIVD